MLDTDLLERLQISLKMVYSRPKPQLDRLQWCPRTTTASAALKRVERALGAELFIRTTRQLRLSSAGERYIPMCEQALLILDQARQNMKDDLDVVEGELRITLSSDLGRNLVIAWLDEFMETYPDVSLRSHISDSNIDFYRDSVDIALRYGAPTDSNLYGFKICNVPALLCASPAYLDKHGTPKHPHDLTRHNGLFYQLYDITYDAWTFFSRGKDYRIKMSGNRASNDGDLVRRWCVAGKCVAVKSCLDMSADLLSGNVVPLMPEFKHPQTELWLVFPSRQSIMPATRLLRDMLREKTEDALKQLVERDILDKNVLA